MQTVSRLIKQFIPKNYKLSLKLNRINRTFDGDVTIIGNAIGSSGTITLHSKDLDIKSVIVDGKEAKFSYGNDDTLIISHSDINAGKHILFISYHAIITDSMHGLYPCYYNHDGVKKELLATQFESHHAREVFPCIDEPEAKSTFDVTLITEPNLTILGNMPIKSQSTENDSLVTKFETTPIMSSYLLAWVVGELHKKTAQTKSGVEVNVWATPAQSSENLDFALDIATRSIDFFDKYFDTPYPLPKCDHVALPDFSSGAMENWGLITYREIALLANPVNTSISSKHYIAKVITHEISHQWFGNLVTMKWWNDLWLNESFASLIEYAAVDALEPSWDIWLDFDNCESIIALRRDSLAGVQSVQTDVNHPDEISTLFDGAIVYAKGARLIQMLKRYIGEKAFQDGLKYYFKEFAYKNTEAIDLWNAFSKSSGKDIAKLMHTWISQSGFPVLHVSQNDELIKISQEQLTSDRTKTSDKLWPIPLNCNANNAPDIFETREATFTKLDDSVLQFNIGNDVHFITHYDHELLKQLILKISNNKLSVTDRLQLLNEQAILANAGIVSSADLIPLLSAYKNETSEAVWSVIGLTINSLKKFVEHNDMADQKLRQLAGDLAKKQFKRLGWKKQPDEIETDTKLRSLIIGLMLFSNNKDITTHAIKLFNSIPLEKIDSEIRGLLISAAVRDTKNEHIDQLMEAYKKTESSELQQDICDGITSTKDPNTAIKLLELVKDNSIIRNQDVARWIVYLIRNKYSRIITWQWIRNNWDWIYETFKGDKSYDEYPKYIANALVDKIQLDEYINFFEPMKSDPILTRAIEMGVNEINDKIKLLERDSQLVINELLNL
ncbi:MAG: aminopeptidase [Patescibacteria group bacterium]|nr:aminopeptidase [Patescibacteria group bacterium]